MLANAVSQFLLATELVRTNFDGITQKVVDSEIMAPPSIG